ncbi:hypothetical protein COUCH_05570 [Couchioplanes caeruleus]|uniref:hypothetical protein n=1 Tax=Couchioplanes caeruleus TaxID=56438 RepID=UPI0020C15F7B|nr:hypothetical protein [Couchioplanes caeruleus]UQU65788.1 hypothetical protein COUCH_05570 [Couchioplanes caeruleus]
MLGQESATKRSPRYGTAVLTSFLWHVTAFAAAWLNTLVDREDTSCDDAGGFCFTAKDGADLLLAVSTAFLFFSMMLSLVTAAGFLRRIRSSVLAGTLAALSSAAVLAMGAVALFALQS